MASYGETKNKSRTKLKGTRAEAEVRGFALGAYGTWFQEQDRRFGLYLDNWIQIGQYRNTITGEAQNHVQKYNSHVFSLSTELGYGIPLQRWESRVLIVTPQIQLTYNHYRGKNFTDGNRLNVKSRNPHSFNGRIGAKLQLASLAEAGGIDPYIEANYLYTSSKYEMDFNRVRYFEDRPRNQFELKTGLNGTINKHFNIGANVGGAWGKNSFREYKAELKIQYRW